MTTKSKIPSTPLPACPFCGSGKSKVQTVGTGAKATYYVVCADCLARTRPVPSAKVAEGLWVMRNGCGQCTHEGTGVTKPSKKKGNTK